MPFGAGRAAIPATVTAAGSTPVPAGRHEPREPADGRVVEILVVVVGDAAQMTGQVSGTPFGAGVRASQSTGANWAAISETTVTPA
jgi:hypothetical protein